MHYIGTEHFINKNAAVRYYKTYGLAEHEVDDKIKAGEIKIGQPTIQQGEKLHFNDEGRYVIEVADK